MSRHGSHGAAVAAAIALCCTLSSPDAHAIDARAEAGAKAALKSAANSYLATNFKAAIAALEKAARACGATRCNPSTKASVLRDLGTMQLLAGDKAAAAKSFAAALALKPDLELNKSYDAPEVRAAWDDAKGGGGGPPPSGDFEHDPAAEQKVSTPLPIYVRPPSGTAVARVVVKYRGARMNDWTRLELRRMGEGWAGMIPCADVTAGAMRYWIQGFDAGGDAVASSGDPKHPFSVPIRDSITSEAPHLPGRPAPSKCGAAAEAAEDEDGLGPARASGGARAGARGAEAEEGTEEREPAASEHQTETGGEAEPPARAHPGEAPYARLWLGLAGAIDFLSMPAGANVCKLDPGTGHVANADSLYCTNPDGTDFPARNAAGNAQNNALVTSPPEAGSSAGGVQSGNVRAMLTLDYALSPSLLVGGRFGVVLNTYPGDAAVKDGRAFGAKFMFEGRATYLFGAAPLTRAGFAPQAFAGLGLSEFDAHTTTVVTLNNVAGQQPVDVWRTGGPLYLTAGGGVRYQFSPRAAFTGNLKLNAVLGGAGMLLTYGPEVGIQYGF